MRDSNTSSVIRSLALLMIILFALSAKHPNTSCDDVKTVNAIKKEYDNSINLHDEGEFRKTPIEIVNKRIKRYRISTLS